MEMKWKIRAKKWIAEALLGMMLTAPAAVSTVEAPQAGILQAEVSEEESLSDGSMPEGSLAVGGLPGDEGDGGAEIMPCGDRVEESEMEDTKT